MDTQPRLDDLIASVNALQPDGDALGHLTDAVTLSGRLGELADHLIGHFVDQARKAGATWTDIGTSMGVSKQAAQKRFVPRGTDMDGSFDGGPYSRFTPRARHVIVASSEEARHAGNDHIGTEHLVLGLLAEPEGLAARALAEQHVSAEQLRAAVKVVLAPPCDAVPDRIPYTPAAKKVHELALREALRLGHNYIGTEHLLLGALAEEQGAGARVLAALGVRRDTTERWILTELDKITRKDNAS